MARTFSPHDTESDRLAAVTLVDLDDHPALKGFKCRNKECEQIVGFTNGAQLYSGALVISQRVRIACGYCGYHMDWRPVIAKIKPVH